MAYAIAPRSRLPGALAAGAAQALLALLIVRGLAAHYLAPAPEGATTTIVAISPPEPEAAPPPPHQAAAAGEGAPPALKAQARPQEAPPPKIVVADPQPVPTQAGSGDADSAGLAAVAGPGSGRGGRGEGAGLGVGGSGSGGGMASPPQRIAGSLSDRDYPRSAAGRGAAGTVAISFRVGGDGRVAGCTVIGSSGDAELDRLTCALVERRFVYRPARNAAGEPVEATLRTTFTWGTRRR